MHNGYLQHFGVRGMRWGVRKYQNRDGTLTELGIRKYAKKKRDLSKLSDEDIRKVISRINLEKQYSEAIGSLRGNKNAGDSERVNLGKMFVQTVLKNAVKSIGKKLGNKVATKLSDHRDKTKRADNDDD